jgi:hypothetical protein
MRVLLDAARRKPIAPSVMGLALTAAAAALFLIPAPGLLRIPMFAFGSILLVPGAIFIYIALYLWLVGTALTIEPGSVLIERRALLFHWQRRFEAGEIADVRCAVSGESESSGGIGPGGSKTFYGIKLTTRAGRSDWLAADLADPHYVAWLTGAIRQVLDLPVATGPDASSGQIPPRA